jgi:hypothetical protein
MRKTRKLNKTHKKKGGQLSEKLDGDTITNKIKDLKRNYENEYLNSSDMNKINKFKRIKKLDEDALYNAYYSPFIPKSNEISFGPDKSAYFHKSKPPNQTPNVSSMYPTNKGYGGRKNYTRKHKLRK